MTRIIAFLAALMAFGPALADDTYQCLNDLTGPLVDVTGMDNLRLRLYSDPTDTRYDARGDVFTYQTETIDGTEVNYPIDIRTASYCFAGGTVVNVNDEGITWGDSKHPNNAAIISIAGRAIFDGVRIHNSHDGIRPRRNPAGWWEIRNSWISYNRDDCIENDFMAAGLVDDSLFDGCYVFLSSRIPDATDYGNTVTVQNSLIHMQEMPGPYGHDDPTVMGHGPLFKYQAESPKLVLRNNIFLMESYVSTKHTIRSQSASATLLGFPAGKIAACSGNIVVWTGPGDFPGDIPDDPSCVTVTKDRAVWDTARANWIAGHPLVSKVYGVDPEPACICEPEIVEVIVEKIVEVPVPYIPQEVIDAIRQACDLVACK